MAGKMFNISLALGWNERYDHKIAVGIIKYSRGRDDMRLYGNDWLFQNARDDTAKPDGIIARITSREDFTRLQAFQAPIVDIANAYDIELPQAINDDHLTGRMGALHLLEKGYPHLAYVDLDDQNWSAKRLQGLREVLRERDLPDNPPVFKAGAQWSKRPHNLSNLIKWLQRLPLPCGIMAANDLLGYRVTLAADMAGIRIPDNLGVVGVDNEDVYCELSQPALTSISCDCERIGMEAAGLLWQILAGEDPLRRVVFPPLGINVRESTNIMVGEDKLVRDIKTFIRANIGRGINVADVAAAFPLSRRALEKRFKTGSDVTLHEEIMEVRLQKARDLLASGASVAEASYESGFRTIPHFYHAFKAKHKMTPLEFAAQGS